MIRVEHRLDKLIERRAQDESETQGKNADQMYRVLLDFLNEFVIDKDFADQQELESTLDQWQTYAQDHGIDTDPYYSRWATIYIDSRDNYLKIETMGLGGTLFLATINRLAE